MKKIIALVLLVSIAVAGAFAAPLIQFGPSVSYEKQVWDGENVIVPGEEISIQDFGIGADVRINLGLMQLAAFADCGSPIGQDFDVISMSGGVSLNTVISLAFIDVFAGAGAHLNATVDVDSNTWTFNGVAFDNFGDLAKTCSLFYRGGATINIGLFGLSVFADIPTAGTFTDGFTFKPSLENTKVSASLLLNIG